MSTEAAATTAAPAKNIRKPNNVIQVSVRKTIFPYIEMTKRLLDQGEKEVEISGLGTSVNSVTSVVDVLTTNNFIKVTKICTSRGDVQEARRVNVPRLQVFVVKSSAFDELYSKEKKEREERRAQIAAEKAAKAGSTEKKE